MIAPVKEHVLPQREAAWHEHFLQLLPAIKRYARVAFQHLDFEQRAEAVQEVQANAWCAYRRLAERGKQDLAYASPLARYAIAQYRAGRRVGQPMNTKDTCSPAAQQKHWFRVQNLGNPYRQGHGWKEGLIDNTHSPVPDQAAFRIDFPAWVLTQTPREQEIIVDLAVGNRTSDVAKEFGITAGRVSQLRRQFEQSWHRFHGEEPNGS